MQLFILEIFDKALSEAGVICLMITHKLYRPVYAFSYMLS